MKISFQFKIKYFIFFMKIHSSYLFCYISKKELKKMKISSQFKIKCRNDSFLIYLSKFNYFCN